MVFLSSSVITGLFIFVKRISSFLIHVFMYSSLMYSKKIEYMSDEYMNT